jgi:hypothetical protein
MSDRLPWFKCNPSKLLGAIAGMDEHEGYVYVTILMRIYETGGPVKDTAKALGRRTGKPEKTVTKALLALCESGKISIAEDGAIDSDTTHETLAEMQAFKLKQQNAAKSGVNKRAEKSEQNQQKPPATAAPRQSHGSANIDRDLDRDSSFEDNSSKGAQAPLQELFEEQPRPQPKASTNPATPEKQLFDRGVEVLGLKGRGMIAKLLKSKSGNVALARAAIEQASTASSPAEYLGRIVNGKGQGPPMTDLVSRGEAW